MIKIQLIIFAIILIFNVNCNPNDQAWSWTTYKQHHKKNYTRTAEESKRQTIWQTNYNKIKKHNQEADRKLHSYRLGVNQFTDLTQEEFQKLWLGLKYVEDNTTDKIVQVNQNRRTTRRHRHRNSTTASPYQTTKTPIQTTTSGIQPTLNGKDWRKLGGVSPVKNQMNCGSCWAFAAAGAIESQYLIKKQKNVILSEQNLVDCSTSYGNAGCDGGWPDAAFQYVQKKGIETSKSYPYKARDQSCAFNSNSVGAKLAGYYSSGNNEAKMTQALDTEGPLAITLNADILQNYISGIINNPSCSKSVNHAVLAVGYGKDNATGLDYYIVKNSWGTSWGENGYFRIARNKNMCGIAYYYGYPVVE